MDSSLDTDLLSSLFHTNPALGSGSGDVKPLYTPPPAPTMTPAPAAPAAPAAGEPAPGMPPMDPSQMAPGMKMGVGFSVKMPVDTSWLHDDLADDPAYKEASAGYADARGVRDAAVAKMGESNAALAGLRPPQEEQFNVQQPQQMLPMLMQRAAPLIALTALGGLLTRQSGMTMLAATNGMVQGVMKGDQQGYAQAQQQYNTEYTRWMQRLKARSEIYKEMREQFKDVADGDRRAAEIADKAVGERQRDMTTASSNFLAEKRLAAQMAQADLRFQQSLAQMQAGGTLGNARAEANFNDVLKQIPKATQGIARLDTSIDYIKSTYDALGRIRQKLAGSGVPLPKSWSEVLTTLSNDPDVAEVNRNLAGLKGTLVGIEMPGGRNNMFLDKIIANQVPDLWTMNSHQVEKGLQNDYALLQRVRKHMEDQVQMWQDRARDMKPEYTGSTMGTADTPPEPLKTSSGIPPGAPTATGPAGTVWYDRDAKTWKKPDGTPVK